MKKLPSTCVLRCSKLLVVILLLGAQFGQMDLSGSAIASKSAGKRAANKPKPLPPEYLEAVKTFNSGKYKDALGQFQHLDETGHCCDKVHYFIAQAYQGMNQTAPAALNYQWVCMYSKDPTLTYYSQVALSRLSYYRGHRTYQGNGNNFSRVTASAPRASGGGEMTGG